MSITASLFILTAAMSGSAPAQSVGPLAISGNQAPSNPKQDTTAARVDLGGSQGARLVAAPGAGVPLNRGADIGAQHGGRALAASGMQPATMGGGVGLPGQTSTVGYASVGTGPVNVFRSVSTPK